MLFFINYAPSLAKICGSQSVPSFHDVSLQREAMTDKRELLLFLKGRRIEIIGLSPYLPNITPARKLAILTQN